MKTVLELDIPPSAEFVAIVRLVVSSLVTARRQLLDERIDDLKLALSEACTNAVEAHLEGGISEPIEVRVREAADRLIVTVADRGPGFDPEALPTHPPVTDPDRLNFERGLGIPLIRTMVDTVDFLPGEPGTTVRLTVFGGPSGSGDETTEILRTIPVDDV